MMEGTPPLRGVPSILGVVPSIHHGFCALEKIIFMFVPEHIIFMGTIMS